LRYGENQLPKSASAARRPDARRSGDGQRRRCRRAAGTA
jgi:hypothetical protein